MNSNQLSQEKVNQKYEDNEDSSEDLQTKKDTTSTQSHSSPKEAIK